MPRNTSQTIAIAIVVVFTLTVLVVLIVAGMQGKSLVSSMIGNQMRRLTTTNPLPHPKTIILTATGGSVSLQVAGSSDLIVTTSPTDDDLTIHIQATGEPSSGKKIIIHNKGSKSTIIVGGRRVTVSGKNEDQIAIAPQSSLTLIAIDSDSYIVE